MVGKIVFIFFTKSTRYWGLGTALRNGWGVGKVHFVVKYGLFQCECKFTGTTVSGVHSERGLCGPDVLWQFCCEGANESQEWQCCCSCSPNFYVIFKYIVVWAYQAELRLLVYYFLSTASFCKLKVDTLVLLNAMCDAENGSWVRLVGYTFRKRFPPHIVHKNKLSICFKNLSIYLKKLLESVGQP